LALNLKEHGWEVVLYNRTTSVAKGFADQGFPYVHTLAEFKTRLTAPRIVWVMVPAGDPVRDTILGKPDSPGLAEALSGGDYIIEGGNSFYKDTQKLYADLAYTGINLVDIGVSGGPGGARHGACLMIGGERPAFDYLEPLFADVSIKDGYQFFPGQGAGHFVKMVHNGIEYGMMQSLAEGFSILKKSPLDINMEAAARIYNNGSVITSRLTEWLLKAYKNFGPQLEGVSGEVEQTGEGAWTVKTAADLEISADIIAGSLAFRSASTGNPSYTGQVLTALRNQFGGHPLHKQAE
jgi:6-phosphogluconate dehydrogenase